MQSLLAIRGFSWQIQTCRWCAILFGSGRVCHLIARDPLSRLSSLQVSRNNLATFFLFPRIYMRAYKNQLKGAFRWGHSRTIRNIRSVRSTKIQLGPPAGASRSKYDTAAPPPAGLRLYAFWIKISFIWRSRCRYGDPNPAAQAAFSTTS